MIKNNDGRMHKQLGKQRQMVKTQMTARPPATDLTTLITENDSSNP
jgi:hypothetical protein